MKWSVLGCLGIFFMVILTLAHPVQAAVELVGPTWRAVEINGCPVKPGQPQQNEPHMVFNADGRVGGSAGCNRFTGKYTLNGNDLHFTPLMMTKKRCRPPINTLERSFVQAMQATKSVRQSGNSLELLDDCGKVVMRLQSRDKE